MRTAERQVELYVGKQAGIKIGYVFVVYRGSTYKGQVRIEHVDETTCSGVILVQLNPITRGDSATTSR